MPLIDPSQIIPLEETQIDTDHQAFALLVNQLETASAAEFSTHFAELVAHIEEHFNYENQLMEKSGFPALAEHKGEHQRVLGQLQQFASRVANGRINFAKAYVDEQLPGWFKLHLVTMDSALIAYLKRQELQAIEH